MRVFFVFYFVLQFGIVGQFCDDVCIDGFFGQCVGLGWVCVDQYVVCFDNFLGVVEFVFGIGCRFDLDVQVGIFDIGYCVGVWVVCGYDCVGCQFNISEEMFVVFDQVFFDQGCFKFYGLDNFCIGLYI